MMGPQQFEEIMRDVLAERDSVDVEPGTGPRFILPITPFLATNSEDHEIEVVGVTGTEDDNENLSFIVLVDRDGETYPIIESSVWRIKRGGHLIDDRDSHQAPHCVGRTISS